MRTWRYDDSESKRVLDSLKSICLRIWLIKVLLVVVIKPVLNDRCSSSTGSFGVKIRIDISSCADIRIARF